MANKRPPSAANLELAEWVSSQGYPTSPRAIRTWRAKKWVAPAIVTPRGYARPTETSNPPEAFDQALVVASIRGGKRTSPDLVVFGLFARGHVVPIDQLRLAFRRQVFDPIQELVQSLSGDEASIDDKVDAIAVGASKLAKRSKSGRFMLRNAKGQAESAPSIVASTQALLATTMLGGDLSQFDLGAGDALDELIDVTAMRGLAEDRVEGLGAIVPGGRDELRDDLLGMFASASLSSLAEFLGSTSYEELATSRDMVQQVIKLGKNMAANVPELGGPETAHGMQFFSVQDSTDEAVAFMSLMFLQQMLRMGKEQVVSSMAELKPGMEKQSALRLLLDRLPPHLQRFVGPGGGNELLNASSAEQEEWAAIGAELERDYPGFGASLVSQEVPDDS
jgi:hypothetical protein